MGAEHRTKESGVQVAVASARQQLSKAIERLESISEPDRESAIHEVRKRIKKARALIRLARGSVARKKIARADDRLREAGRPLSELRDASVLIQTLDGLARRSVELAVPVDFAEVRSGLVADRDRLIREQIEPGKMLARVAKLLGSTRQRLGKWDFDGADDRPIKAFQRAYRQGRDAFRDARADPSADSLHRLRKRVKALGYQLKTIEADPSGPVSRLQNLAGLLAEELGEIHDLDVLHDRLAAQDASSPIFETLDRRRLDLRHTAMQRAGVVFRDKPGAFIRLVEAAHEPEPAPLQD